MPNVAFVHPLARILLPSYLLISDCLAGEAQIKYKRMKYLPSPNPGDTSEANRQRYEAYLTRAVFYNVAQRTLAGMNGQVFLRDPVVEVPALLNDLLVDATGTGVPLNQLAQLATGFGVSHGRCGVYVDYPSTITTSDEYGPLDINEAAEPVVTVAQLEAGDIRPTIRVIKPEDCINWRVKKRGAKLILSLVVFREDMILDDDGFQITVRDQWRVLRLDETTGEYVVEIYKHRNGSTPDETYYPTDAKGVRLTDIPFTFVGAVNNEPSPGVMPLYDICSVNIAHYRNSADYEEAVYMLGQPTAWFSGLTEEWVKNVMGGVVALGSRAVIPLPINASAGLLQVTPNTMAKEAMDQKEAQMLALGGKLVEGSQVQRTATEADIDNISETSVLSTVASNVANAFLFGLKWAARFAGAVDTGIKFELNTEFDLVDLSPEERKSLLMEWQAGGIVTDEYRANMRRAGIATLSDAQYKTVAAAEDAERIAAIAAETAAIAADPSAPPPGGA